MFLNGSQANVTRRIEQIEEVHLPNSPLIKCFFRHLEDLLGLDSKRFNFLFGTDSRSEGCLDFHLFMMK